MKLRFITYILLSATITLITAMLPACTDTRTRVIQERMALVDTLLFTDPAAALDTLATLPDSIKDPETVAWRNLLSAKASSKAFQPLPSDTILARTANFYNGRGDSLETQSRYYYGYKLLLNNNYDTALVELYKAFTISKSYGDNTYAAFSARAIGNIYSHLSIIDDEIEWTQLSYLFFEKAQLPIHASAAKISTTKALTYASRFNEAKNLLAQIDTTSYSNNRYIMHSYAYTCFDLEYVMKNYNHTISYANELNNRNMVYQ